MRLSYRRLVIGDNASGAPCKVDSSNPVRFLCVPGRYAGAQRREAATTKEAVSACGRIGLPYEALA